MILNLNLQTTKHGHDCLLCQDMFIASLGGCGMAGWNLRCNLIKAVRCGPLWLSLPTSCQHDSLQWQKSKGYGWKSQEWALRVEESAFGDPVYAWPSSSVASCVLEGFELRKSDRKNWVPFLYEQIPFAEEQQRETEGQGVYPKSDGSVSLSFQSLTWVLCAKHWSPRDSTRKKMVNFFSYTWFSVFVCKQYFQTIDFKK